VQRVLVSDGVIATWTYGLSKVNAAVDAVFMRLYDGILGPYWPAERRHVENGYADLPFPFQRIDAPAFAMQCTWTLPQYIAYLGTWSATQRYVRERGEDPVALIREDLAAAWGDPAQARALDWPLNLRVGRALRG
jgi:hypothetical protein